LETRVESVPPKARLLVRLLIVLDVLLLVLVVVLRVRHPAGHDEVNALETGLRMLGSYGNPQQFLHASFLYDAMAVLHGVVFAARGLLGQGWDQGQYLENYLEHRDLYLLAGRLLIVGFSALLLWAVNRLAEVLYGGAAGLLATALLCFSALLPLAGTALKDDLPAAAMATLAMVVLCDPSLRLRELVKWRMAGALAGMAVATKYTVAPVVCIPLVMAAGDKTGSPAKRIVAFAGCAALAFAVCEPYLFIDFPAVIASVQLLQQHLPGSQLVHHMAPRYLLDYFPLGLGVLLTCAAVPAAVSASLRRGTPARAMVLYLTIITAVFMWATSGQARYLIVLAPFLCVLIGGELLRLKPLRFAGNAAIMLLALVLTWPAGIISVKIIGLLSRPDTTEEAKAWIEARVPAGSTILLEGTTDSEPSEAPPLVPVNDWFVRRIEEAKAAGTSGRLLMAAAAVSARRTRPRYDIVETSIGSIDSLEGIDFLVLSTQEGFPSEFHRIVHPDDPPARAFLQARAAAMQRVGEAYTLVASFRPNPVLRYVWFGNPDFSRMRAAPIQSFGTWKMGPRIDVYRRADAQLAHGSSPH
jgi:hypothetical protein